VEDNPDDVTLTEMALKKGRVDNKLVVACDGQEALDLLFCEGKYANRESGENPTIILLDLKLPFVSGLDVLKEIRADNRTRNIPVIVLTSSIEDRDKTESYVRGANEFICKPTGFSQYIEAIQKIKARWLD
jgi:two-component system, response regulator